MANARQFMATRTAAWVKSGGWVNPYVTTGLIAMWDGEWNSIGPDGIPVHDASSRVWRDLVGSRDFTLTENPVIRDKYIQSSAQWVSEALDPVDGICTIEVCCEFNTIGINQVVFSAKRSGNYGVTRYLFVYDADNKVYFGDNKAAPAVQKAVRYTMSGVWNEAESSTIDSVYYNSVKQELGTARFWNVFDSLIIGSGYLTIERNRFAGKIHSIRLYSVPLTDAQVKANYDVDCLRFDIPAQTVA